MLRIYLLGITFKIVTDCSAFQKTMDKKELAPRVVGWAVALQEFKYTIEHRSGNRLKHIEALSRHQVMCAKTKLILEILKERPYQQYFVRDGLLYFEQEGRDVVVVPEAMQSQLIRSAHERGHFAAQRRKEHLKQDFYIPNFRQKVDDIISNCIRCILNNKKN